MNSLTPKTGSAVRISLTRPYTLLIQSNALLIRMGENMPDLRENEGRYREPYCLV